VQVETIANKNTELYNIREILN